MRVPGDRRSRGTITLHRGKLEAADVTTVDGIPVTTVARTLLDLAGVLSRQQLIRAIEAAERRQLFDLSRTTAPAPRRCSARAIESYGSPTGGSTLIPKGSWSCSPS
ncbi:MAG: hypothetical protein M3076_05375 [Actinomycetota bacterium]|nr:hypothetical protein [Actinomycetota bacterium]